MTQPLLQAFIDKHPSVTRLYAQSGWPGSAAGAAPLAASSQQVLLASKPSHHAQQASLMRAAFPPG